jgi:Bifunctional DNA primase/polymerase, N-terminal
MTPALALTKQERQPNHGTARGRWGFGALRPLWCEGRPRGRVVRPLHPQMREYTQRLDLQRLPIIAEFGEAKDGNVHRWAAIFYGRAGIPVFPLVPGRKIPHKGSAGVDDATTDLRRIRTYWTRHPQDNIGLACGAVFDVLDVDTKDGRPGYESLRRLRLAGLTQGTWGAALTPTGGRHILFEPSGDGNHADRASGLDFRGVGGYIVAAPSRTDDGVYRWEFSDPDARGRTFDWGTAMECLYGPPPKPEHRVQAAKDLVGLVGFVERAQPGGRNTALYWAACRAHEQGLSTGELLAAAITGGLAEAEASRTIASGNCAPQRRPA